MGRRPTLAFWIIAGVSLAIGLGIGAAAADDPGTRDELRTTKAELADTRSELADTERARDEAEARVKTLSAKGEVPDLTGGTVDEAESAVAEFEWKIKTTSQPSEKDPGTVLSQSPEEGTILKTGRSIRLIVAKPAPKQWQTIASFSGRGSKKTDEFTIPDGPKARIKYTFTGDTNAILSLEPVGGPEYESETLLNEIGDYSDTTRVYESGRFYLEVQGGSWTIEVQVFK
jgi:PASTA domain